LFSAADLLNLTQMKPRQASISRNTHETKISIRLNLDGKGK
jgi:imidazoleglycerol phosphate dehydratase HisB